MANDPEAVEAVARKLTEAQREALLSGCGCNVGDDMERDGLWQRVFPENPHDFVTTPLGIAVRAYLQARTEGGLDHG